MKITKQSDRGALTLMRKIFESIYLNKVWYKGSGSGSLPKNTVKYRTFLQNYIRKNKIKKVIDIGCGDWGFSRMINWKGIGYLGIDVVDFVIKADKKNWETDNIRFRCADVRKIKLPEADMVIIKDVLQHWTNSEILSFIKRLKNFPHVIVTNTYSGKCLTKINSEIRNGEAHPLDLSLPPFNYKIKELLRYKAWRPVKKVWETKSVVRLL